MIKKILIIGLSLIVFSCTNKTISEINTLKFETYSSVVRKIPEIGERISNLVKNDYNTINGIMVESNPAMSPVIDNFLYSFFGENENGEQVYIIIDISNNNILIGYYNAINNKVKVYEEKEGLTIFEDFNRWVNGE